jgi:hypothetical protein
MVYWEVKMAGEWYYKFMGDIVGPKSTNELRKCASNGEIQFDTWVRKGENGEWVTAEKIKGLFSTESDPNPPVDSPDDIEKNTQKEAEVLRTLGVDSKAEIRSAEIKEGSNWAPIKTPEAYLRAIRGQSCYSMTRKIIDVCVKIGYGIIAMEAMLAIGIGLINLRPEMFVGLLIVLLVTSGMFYLALRVAHELSMLSLDIADILIDQGRRNS